MCLERNGTVSKIKGPFSQKQQDIVVNRLRLDNFVFKSWFVTKFCFVGSETLQAWSTRVVGVPSFFLRQIRALFVKIQQLEVWNGEFRCCVFIKGNLKQPFQPSPFQRSNCCVFTNNAPIPLRKKLDTSTTRVLHACKVSEPTKQYLVTKEFL